MTVSPAQRALFRKQGRCTNCGGERDRADRLTCEDCRLENQRWQKEAYRRRVLGPNPREAW